MPSRGRRHTLEREGAWGTPAAVGLYEACEKQPEGQGLAYLCTFGTQSYIWVATLDPQLRSHSELAMG